MLKPKILNFYGFDDGSYSETHKYLLDSEFDWTMVGGLSSKNNWQNYDVNGATEFHVNYRKAFLNMVKEHPELYIYEITFDGPPKVIRDLVKESLPDPIEWDKITFYHGTSSILVKKILEEGICPRTETGSPAIYGSAASSAPPGNPYAVSLTTRKTAARFAARDAAKILGGSPAVIVMSGIHFDENRLIPDPDSREATAQMSLQRLGSIGYLGTAFGQVWDIERI